MKKNSPIDFFFSKFSDFFPKKREYCNKIFLFLFFTFWQNLAQKQHWLVTLVFVSFGQDVIFFQKKITATKFTFKSNLPGLNLWHSIGMETLLQVTPLDSLLQTKGKPTQSTTPILEWDYLWNFRVLGINVLFSLILFIIKEYKPNQRDIAFSKLGTKSVHLMTSCLKPYCYMAPRFSNVALEMGKHYKFKWIDETIVAPSITLLPLHLDVMNLAKKIIKFCLEFCGWQAMGSW